MTALTAVAKGHQVGFAADTPALGFTALLTRFHVNCFMLIGKMRLKENVDCMLSLTFSLSLAAPPQSSFRNCFAEQCGELKTLAGSLFAYWLKCRSSPKASHDHISRLLGRLIQLYGIGLEYVSEIKLSLCEEI
jgi:hypothetical protein